MAGTTLRRRRSRWGKVAAIALTALATTGCVRYELGLQFNWMGGGEITQDLSWDSMLAGLANELEVGVTDQLIAEVERRAEKVEGSLARISDSHVRVTIPFDRYSELEEKVDAFINEPWVVLPDAQSQLLPQAPVQLASNAAAAEVNTVFSNEGTPRDSIPSGRAIAQATVAPSSELEIDRQSFILMDRYILTYDLDLRGVAVDVPGGLFSLSIDRLLDLTFSLQTPLRPSTSNATSQVGNRLTWDLETGRVNRLEAVFWLPSWIALVTLIGAIVAIVVAGWVWSARRRRDRDWLTRLANSDDA
ncbi:MAG: DUF3153 domain-containing protein [Cyanobacteria bacterium P01_F01_bin.33]